MAAIVEDSRQQDGKHGHIGKWMEAHGVEFMPRASALPFGDYMRDGSNVSVDTKKDVQEVAGNVGKDHARFIRECERARVAGYRLVILVEEHPEYNDRTNLYGWRSKVCLMCRKCNPSKATRCMRSGKPRPKPMSGQTLAKIIQKIETEYDVRFEFCNRRDTARRICELLGVNYESS